MGQVLRWELQKQRPNKACVVYGVNKPLQSRLDYQPNFAGGCFAFIFIPRHVAEGGYCYHPRRPSGCPAVRPSVRPAGWVGVNIYSCECDNS